MTDRYLVFALDEQRFAVRLADVDRVVRMVEVAPLAQAPSVVMGVVNIAGCIAPVFDIRLRLGLPRRDISLSDHLILASTSRRPVVLRVDEVLRVADCPPEDRVSTRQLVSEAGMTSGIAKLPDGLALIHDLDGFLSAAEESALAEALAAS